METFGDVWRAVAAHAVDVDPLLCREWTLEALRAACAGRRWGFLRRDLRIQTRASRTQALTATPGSAQLLGAFQAPDAGRQLRVGTSGRPYQILQVDPGVSATLHQPWAGTSGALTGTILDAYLMVPADFDGFRTITHLEYQRPLPWWLDVALLDQYDPLRQHTDTHARAVFGRVGVLSGPYAHRVLYEWYPYVTGVGTYDLTYYAKPQLADEDPLPGVFQGRGYLLQKGALAEAASYPGSAAKRNPYFNLGLKDRLDREWQQGLQELEVRDDEILPGEQVEAVDWRGLRGTAGVRSDRALRGSDADLGDFY